MLSHRRIDDVYRQGLLMFDVDELLAVYQEMVKADRLNHTDFAKEQQEYIEQRYPQVVFN